MHRLSPAILLVACALAACGKKADAPANDTTKPATSSSAPTTSTPTSDSTPGTTTATGQPAPTDSSDITGAYFAIGALPSEFAEIDHLSLANIDENAKPAPLNGFIRPKKQSAKDYKLVDPQLGGTSLVFTTEAVDGISYSFNGTFNRLANFPMNPPASDEAILQGMLKKMKDGQQVAETLVKFSYEAGG